MRTTITMNDNLFRMVKRRAGERGVSVSAFIAAAVDDALKRGEGDPDPPPFELLSVGGGGVYDHVDLDRPRELITAEDEERYR